MQFKTLLPPAAAHASTRRTWRIVDEDDRFQVEATTFLACPDEEVVLQIRVWTAGRWCVIGLDGDGVLRATAWADGEREAESRWEDLMSSFGLTPLVRRDPLLPPKDNHGGARRSSVLHDLDGQGEVQHQVAAKRLITEDGELLQLRVWVLGVWTQIVLDELLGMAAFAAADTEKASWKAVQAGLRARGWNV